MPLSGAQLSLLFASCVLAHDLSDNKVASSKENEANMACAKKHHTLQAHHLIPLFLPALQHHKRALLLPLLHAAEPCSVEHKTKPHTNQSWHTRSQKRTQTTHFLPDPERIWTLETLLALYLHETTTSADSSDTECSTFSLLLT